MTECLNCGATLVKSEEGSGVCYPCQQKLPQIKLDELRELSEGEREELRAQLRAQGLSQEAQASEEEIRSRKEAAEVQHKKDAIILTTETCPAGLHIEKRLEIVTAECVFGMNVLYEFLAGVRDIVGGRSGTMQKLFRDARQVVLRELREEAYQMGAAAVVGITFQYSELSGKGSAMIMVVATGTAVRLKE